MFAGLFPPPSVADGVHGVADAQDARPLDGVQLSKERSGFGDALLRRYAKTIAVKSRRDEIMKS